MDFDIVPSWRVNVTVSSTELGQNPNLYYDVSMTRWHKRHDMPDHLAGLRYDVDDDLQCIGVFDGSWSGSLQLWLFTKGFRLDHVAAAASHINAAGFAGSWLSFLSTIRKS
jgi:hypothetical protein